MTCILTYFSSFARVKELSLFPFPIMHKVLAIKQRCYNFIHYSRENQSICNAHKSGSAHSDIDLLLNFYAHFDYMHMTLYAHIMLTLRSRLVKFLNTWG